jgi:hypothetical protein
MILWEGSEIGGPIPPLKILRRNVLVMLISTLRLRLMDHSSTDDILWLKTLQTILVFSVKKI